MIDRNSINELQRDIQFLKEIREVVETIFPPSGDTSKQNHAFQLIDDWITELEKVHDEKIAPCTPPNQ